MDSWRAGGFGVALQLRLRQPELSAATAVGCVNVRRAAGRASGSLGRGPFQMSTFGSRSSRSGHSSVPWRTRTCRKRVSSARTASKTGPRSRSRTLRSICEPSVKVRRIQKSSSGSADRMDSMVPIISRERRDLQRLMSVGGKAPISCQLRLVMCRPLHDQAEGTRGDAAVEDGQRPDVDLDLGSQVFDDLGLRSIMFRLRVCMAATPGAQSRSNLAWKKRRYFGS